MLSARLVWMVEDHADQLTHRIIRNLQDIRLRDYIRSAGLVDSAAEVYQEQEQRTTQVTAA
jgi:hypothetical protein